MNRQTLSNWLDEFTRAWMLRDPRHIATLFHDQGIFKQSPFNEGRRGYDAILDYWEEFLALQEDCDVNYDILTVRPEMGIVQWWASYTEVGETRQIKLDGIAVLRLDEQQHCLSFYQWWNRVELPLGSE